MMTKCRRVDFRIQDAQDSRIVCRKQEEHFDASNTCAQLLGMNFIVCFAGFAPRFAGAQP